MQFCVNALGHNSSQVRDVSERIIKELYKEVGQPVKDYLPPDNDKTRKITLYRQLFEYFDKVDGKPSKADIKVIKFNIPQVFVSPAKHSDTKGSLFPSSVRPSVCPSVTIFCHTFQSYVSQATHAFLGMLPLFLL